jgi:hypothetical protein
MRARLRSNLVLSALVLIACDQGGSWAPNAVRSQVTPSPRAPVAAELHPNVGRALTRPKRSPIPLRTADVPDPQDVSLHRFAPADARVLQVRPIRGAGGVPAQLVLTWERGDESAPRELGLLLWQYTGGLRVSWKVVYLIHDRPRNGVAQAGPPGDLHRTREAIGISGIGFDLGDLTGDGHHELLTEEHGSGTAGCAFFRVLATEGSEIRQIRVEETCETHMNITRDGLLEISEAVYPKWCESPHGCALRIRSLKWNGGAWQQVGKRHKPL